MMNTTARVVLVSALLLGGCSRMAYKSKVDEFRNEQIPAARFTTITVLPYDQEGFDAGIAARVRDNLKKQGINVVTARMHMTESEVSIPQLCPKVDAPEYKGVLWVTFDRIVLRDCETSAVAFRAIGGYAGVDVLARRLVAYLKTGGAGSTIN